MKQDLRILLPSVVIFLLSFLDRTNVANARVLNQATGDSLLQTLHFTNHEFVVSLMLFLVAYAAFEAPSNLMLKRFHPSRWIAFLMMTWGILTMTLAAVESYAAFTIVRVLLGAAEAGLFPGLVFILTFWYKTNERILRIALIFASGCAAGAFGGAIAYGIGHLNGRNGLEGWRSMVIHIGGNAKLRHGNICVSLFPDWPETAKWLSPEERALAVARLIGDASSSVPSELWEDALV
ncbi:hypothetical protein BOTBODRAFT_57091 [Botryobasidium botryosum FD-172 SS1]|uniref:Major facilitator superfamily (MFS) profile domain-containing protein n=1 Tax=Botryobasidium botryosum (strain FD-172 SS1) TaxID=930990 RepID=A0A067M8B9_BOTB1|nr:hypothetical protein BOTBODRAFT_57091 [Botryobasidium botryosum FD-172 SS1]